jgi:phosphomannomutase
VTPDWPPTAMPTVSARSLKMAASWIRTKIFCVLLRWLLERKNWPGDVVTRAFNTTRMLDRIAAKYGRKLYETPIGFKYAADLMMEHDILIGGEEIGRHRLLAFSAGA